MKICLVNSDIYRLNFFSEALKNHELYKALDYPCAQVFLKGTSVDIILANLSTCSLDIFNFVKIYNISSPVILLSENMDERLVISCLYAGAIDVLPYSISSSLLLAKLNAVYKASLRDTSPISIEIGAVKLCPQSGTCYVKGREVCLPKKEFDILKLLISHPNRIWNKEDIITKVWGYDPPSCDKLVETHICWLRKIIEEDSSNPKYIKTVRGYGYKFADYEL